MSRKLIILVAIPSLLLLGACDLTETTEDNETNVQSPDGTTTTTVTIDDIEINAAGTALPTPATTDEVALEQTLDELDLALEELDGALTEIDALQNTDDEAPEL